MAKVTSGLQNFVVPPSFCLRSGEPLHPEAFLAYETFGELNADRSNAILWPTCYTQRSQQQRLKIGDGERFDPSRYFIVTINMLGNGVSYSPTTEGIGQEYPTVPVTYFDNVSLQEELMRFLGIPRWALIYGFSIGAMLALQWAVQFPEKVASVVAVCGSARCNPANSYFLKSLQRCLCTDPHSKFNEKGHLIGFHEKPMVGLRAFALTYADWIFDAPSTEAGASPNHSRPEYARSKPGGRVYIDGLYKERIPCDSEAEFIEAWVNTFVGNWDAMEYYAVSQTWLSGDVASEHGGELSHALGKVEALVYLMPSSTDQYFICEEIEQEAKYIPRCVFEPLLSPFGHVAEGRPECQAQIQRAISICLEEAMRLVAAM